MWLMALWIVCIGLAGKLVYLLTNFIGLYIWLNCFMSYIAISSSHKCVILFIFGTGSWLCIWLLLLLFSVLGLLHQSQISVFCLWLPCLCNLDQLIMRVWLTPLFGCVNRCHIEKHLLFMEQSFKLLGHVAVPVISNLLASVWVETFIQEK